MNERLIGKLNPMYGRSVYDVWLKKYGKEEADKKWKIRYDDWKHKCNYVNIDEYKDSILDLYFNKMESMRFIGKMYGFSHHVISRRLTEWGYENKKRSKSESLKELGYTVENLNSDKYNEDYKKWRQNVMERDNHKCQLTGKADMRLEVHHLKSYTRHINERYELNNGITLSKNLHRKFHYIYGNEFTENNFVDFKNKVLNGEL